MPPVSLADTDLTSMREEAAAPATRTSAPVPSSHRPLRLAGLLRLRPKTRRTYQDPLFKRPDLVEDDYYRLRRQPSGG
jgi:hypothetical protein